MWLLLTEPINRACILQDILCEGRDFLTGGCGCIIHLDMVRANL